MAVRDQARRVNELAMHGVVRFSCNDDDHTTTRPSHLSFVFDSTERVVRSRTTASDRSFEFPGTICVLRR